MTPWFPIAIALLGVCGSFLTTVAWLVWKAASLTSRIEGLEKQIASDVTPHRHHMASIPDMREQDEESAKQLHDLATQIQILNERIQSLRGDVADLKAKLSKLTMPPPFRRPGGEE